MCTSRRTLQFGTNNICSYTVSRSAGWLFVVRLALADVEDVCAWLAMCDAPVAKMDNERRAVRVRQTSSLQDRTLPHRHLIMVTMVHYLTNLEMD